jgi:DNA-directed RNA polymerase subunit H (RpoH/RPB5)
METKALEILKLMLSRRGLKVADAERLTPEGLESANLYLIGTTPIVFSQKARGLLERDIEKLIEFVKGQGYENGMVLVTMAHPSDHVLKVVKSYAKDRLQLFHIRQLQFDITTHRYATPHRILNEEERKKVFDTYKITKPEDQLPWIDSQDAMAKWIGAVPGDIVEVMRHSDVAGRVPYYRYCVEDSDANVA